jgi:hypothetical protein
MKRITLVGATMLATLATNTNFIIYVKYYEPKWLKYNFVTNISVVLDLVREVKNIYYSNVYNNMYQ